MISQQQKQEIIRNANDAQGHARMVLAKCIAGLAVLVLLAVAGAMGTPAERKDAARAQPSAGQAEQLRREAFEAHRAYYEAEQARAKKQQSAAR